MVKAANRKGNIAPMKSPIVVGIGDTSIRFEVHCLVKARTRPVAVTAAEAMANPLAIAAVVLPKESRASVASRTFGGRWAISAIRPALSAIGP